MPLTAKLVVVGGEVKSAEIKLRLPSTIGRGRGATIMLPHPLVSRQHCELFETNGRLMVRDLGSLNGTFVNNERISEATLPPGELLTVGAVTFRAVYDVQDSSGPPAGPGPQLKTGHSRDTDPNGTIRAVPAQAAEAPSAEPHATEPAPMTEDDADFNFDQPLTPVDEGPRPPTDRAPVIPENKSDAALEAKATEPAAANKPAAAKPSASQPATPKAAVPAKPAPAPSPETEKPAHETPAKDAKVDFSKWEHEEEDPQPAGHEDDDFGDFLKSLGTK